MRPAMRWTRRNLATVRGVSPRGSVETRDLARAIEDVSGRNFDEFFDRWIARAGHPELEASWDWDAERNVGLHAYDGLHALWAKLVGRRHPGLKLTAAATLAVALFFSFASGSFRVSADATVEGQVQRAITAPMQGFIREAAKRAGDTVKAGESFGRLDDRDLKLERVRLSSQYAQYGKQSSRP